MLGQGENLPDEDAADALATLNEIVDKWNVESLMIISNKSISFNLTGKKSYTIGPGGDINADRPPSGIFGAYYNMPNQGGVMSIPLMVVNESEYDSILRKDLEINQPDRVLYVSSYPLAEVFVYPICSTGEVVLSVQDQFKAFESLDEIVDLPSGYIKALRCNLAVELGPEYGRAVDPDVKELAIGAKAAVKITNGSQRVQAMVCDTGTLGGGRGFNIFTGY